MNISLRLLSILVVVIYCGNTMDGQTIRQEAFKIQKIDSIPVYYLIYAIDSIGKKVIILSERQSSLNNTIDQEELTKLQTESSYYLEIERTAIIYLDESREEFMRFNRHLAHYIDEKLVSDKTNLPYFALNLYGLYLRNTDK